ncbi:MAG TPA: class I tRNA ligase family protein, partial [Acidimicrobiia bacterium]|nr:class I tRNA ligase family protein [Acidimicrobiia bacterium]
FGEVDREVGEREGLPILNPVDAAARFDASVPPWQGRFVKDADPSIIDALAASGRLERVVDYTHSYPHCWRCGTPLVYWAKPTWFARTSARKDELLAQNETIGWHPENIKHGRFGDWLQNNVDWALSRDRFWGTPIPVWRCGSNHDTCVGSVARLAELAGRDLSDLDLHRPYVDDVTIDCPQCGGRATRVEPVLDAWFDSGSMPSAQFHFPFENEELFARRFPADFICEAIDQTRGWFYSLLAVNTLVFKRTPYRNVVCLGLLVGEDGQKMSKSRGNVIDPWTILESRGADALRWYFFSAGSPWVTRRVSVEGIDESTRRFLLTLWNTYAFFVTYASLDGWTPDAAAASARPSHVLDRWIRSRLHRTVREVTDALDSFDALRGAQALDGLVDDLSNWYVRRSRPRFWKAADASAHATLHECLTTIALLLAPYCPFVADELWQNLRATKDSVHLQDWPAVDGSAIDDGLEAEMASARLVASLGLAARNDARLKVRQPLRRALVLLPDGVRLGDEVVREVADELNVKTLEPVENLEGILDYRVVPNFRALGPRVGKDVPRVKAALADVDGADVRAALDTDGVFRLDLGGGTVVDLGPGDVEVRAESHEELVLAQEEGTAVALDTTIDDELRHEGWVRDVIRAVNEARKQRGLEIADRIALTLTVPAEIHAAIDAARDVIATEVLARTITVESGVVASGDADAVELDAGTIRIAFEKVG